MARWQHGVVGNPSGSHRAAREARRAVEDARDEIAALVGAKPGGVIFTGGGTESCQLAIVGAAHRYRRSHERCEIVVSKIEHHAVLDAAEMMARDFDDVSVRYVDVDAEGVIDLDSLRGLINEHTAVVSVMAVNNETGVRQPFDGVNSVVRCVPGEALTHTDAVAAAPWLSLPVVTATTDMVSICAHKIGGPVNSGALILRNNAAVDAVMPGGGQERGRRGGTVDVAAAVGLATALRLTDAELTEVNDRVIDYQEKLTAAFSFLPGCQVTARRGARPGHGARHFRGSRERRAPLSLGSGGRLCIGRRQLFERGLDPKPRARGHGCRARTSSRVNSLLNGRRDERRRHRRLDRCTFLGRVSAPRRGVRPA